MARNKKHHENVTKALKRAEQRRKREMEVLSQNAYMTEDAEIDKMFKDALVTELSGKKVVNEIKTEN